MKYLLLLPVLFLVGCCQCHKQADYVSPASRIVPDFACVPGNWYDDQRFASPTYGKWKCVDTSEWVRRTSEDQ